MDPAIIIFWFSMGFVGYTYFVYPILIFAIARTHREVVADPASVRDWPTVAVVVPVYNGQEYLERKLNTLRGIQYPKDRIRFIFVSDGSTDGSDTWLSQEPDVEVLCFDERQGKPNALNAAVGSAQDEIILFTDVRQEIDPPALRFLVASLLQPGVGAVSGELILRDALTGEGHNIGLYWRYEKWIRRQESRAFATIGVTGALYVLRRKDYEPLPADTLLDDFEVPARVLRRGQRVLFDPRAHVFDSPQEDSRRERVRKVRTLTGNFQAFARNAWLFHPLRNPVFLQFLSHKVFRLMVPYAMVSAYLSNWWLDGFLYQSMALAQTVFYIGGVAGMSLPSLRKHRLVSFVVVFLELNWAAVLALQNYLMGRIEVRWEKT